MLGRTVREDGIDDVRTRWRRKGGSTVLRSKPGLGWRKVLSPMRKQREKVSTPPFPAGECVPRLLNAYKKPFERQREICEDYSPCENFARFRGYNRAYQHFFGKPGQTTRNRY
ncbi:MGP protein, partial [Polypterus senegalus]